MSQAELNDWIVFGLKASAIIFVLAYGRKILGIIKASFGRIDKSEILAMIFTPVLIYMLWLEGLREHQWELYEPYKIGIVTLIVMYGFGLRPVLKYLLLLKGVDPKALDEKPDEDTDHGDSGAAPIVSGPVVK